MAAPQPVAPYTVDAQVVSNDLITHDTRLLRLRLLKERNFDFAPVNSPVWSCQAV